MNEQQSIVALELLAQGFTASQTAHALGLPEEAVTALRERHDGQLVPRTAPMRAIPYTDRTRHRQDKLPGAVFFTDPGDAGVSALWFICPCGCGLVQRITVGVEHKPHMAGPSWRWNGSTSEPTLHPSVNIERNEICPGWHGWLRDGYWERC